MIEPARTLLECKDFVRSQCRIWEEWPQHVCTETFLDENHVQRPALFRVL